MALDPKRVAECVFDITTVACSIFVNNPDPQSQIIEDSRDLFHHIYEWATEFEKENPDPVDYLLEIEMFAYKKLAEVGLIPLTK